MSESHPTYLPTERVAPASLPYTQEDVRALWKCAREHNSTISDEALDLMRDALLAGLQAQAQAGASQAIQAIQVPESLRQLSAAASPDWEARPHGVLIGGEAHAFANGSAKSQIASFTAPRIDDESMDPEAVRNANTQLALECVAFVRHQIAQPQKPVTVGSLLRREWDEKTAEAVLDRMLDRDMAEKQRRP